MCLIRTLLLKVKCTVDFEVFVLKQSASLHLEAEAVSFTCFTMVEQANNLQFVDHGKGLSDNLRVYSALWAHVFHFLSLQVNRALKLSCPCLLECSVVSQCVPFALQNSMHTENCPFCFLRDV